MARGLILGSVFVAVTFVGTASVQQPDQLEGLEKRVARLESELNDVGRRAKLVTRRCQANRVYGTVLRWRNP